MIEFAFFVLLAITLKYIERKDAREGRKRDW